MTPEKLREAAELLAQNSVRAFPKELESAIKLAADACTTLADMLTDASVDFEGFDECEGAAISKKTIDNPTPQNIYDYGKAVWQAALALCERNRAAQMESATHGFDEWVLSWGRSHAIQESEGDVIEWVKAAWHAAQAAMQAKLDAANERVKELEAYIDGVESEVAKVYCAITLNEFSKANTDADYVLEKVEQLAERDNARLHKAEESLRICGFVDNGGELWKPPINKDAFAPKFFEAEAAIATAERNVELLRGEVRRIQEWLTPGTKVNVLIDRSPEVRALVDAAGSSGATG